MKYREDIAAHFEKMLTSFSWSLGEPQVSEAKWERMTDCERAALAVEELDDDERAALLEARDAVTALLGTLRGLSPAALGWLGIEARGGQDPPWPEGLSDSELTAEMAVACLLGDSSLSLALLERERLRRDRG